MLTKEYIKQLTIDNHRELYRILQTNQDSNYIIFILENLGSLPDDFDGKLFLPFLESDNNKVRILTLKNLGKLKNIDYLNIFKQMAENDLDSLVRREAVSAIGRLRNKATIPYLLKFLNDNDPKIILQAIRALLVFKNEEFVQTELIKLINHPNEIIQQVIRKNFYSSANKSLDDHSKSPNFLKNKVILGDVRNIIKIIPDQTIHLTFTSPPYYNARDYSIYKSYNEYLDFLTELFQEVHRITKEGRFLIVNTSPIIIPRMSRNHASKRYPIPFDLNSRLVANGWEFIDDITWVKPESSVKNRNGGFMQHRKPLGYKPNVVTEYIMVYRKQTDKLLDWNMSQYDRETVEKSKILGDYESRNIWEINPTFDRVHSAVFPIELCQRVIKFYSYMGDLVFDPFGGSGTMGRAALSLDRYFLLTEKEPKYVERMKEDLGVKTLFTTIETEFLTFTEFAEKIRG
jgi:DNA modification methylase